MEMLPVLQAEDALHRLDIQRIGGGLMKREHAAPIVRTWKRISQGRSKPGGKPARVRQREKRGDKNAMGRHAAMASAMGIGVQVVPTKERADANDVDQQ